MNRSRLTFEHETLASALASAALEKQVAAVLAAVQTAVSCARVSNPLIDEAVSVLAGQDLQSSDRSLLRQTQSRLHELVENADEFYFSLEEQGSLEESGEYFALARIASGLEFALGLDTWSLQEAAYEVIKSLEEPGAIIASAETVLV